MRFIVGFIMLFGIAHYFDLMESWRFWTAVLGCAVLGMTIFIAYVADNERGHKGIPPNNTSSAFRRPAPDHHPNDNSGWRDD